MRLGVDRPPAQFPFIDPMRCIGCGTCVERLPRGRRAGDRGRHRHGRERAALRGPRPLRDRLPGRGDRGRPRRPQVAGRTSPLLDAWQQTTVPGLFVAGELGGLALVKNAMAQARKVVDRIAQIAPAARGRGRRRRPRRGRSSGRARPASPPRPRRASAACPTSSSSRRGTSAGRSSTTRAASSSSSRPSTCPILGHAPRGGVREGGPARRSSRTCAGAARSTCASGSGSRASSAPAGVFSVRSTSGVTLAPAT